MKTINYLSAQILLTLLVFAGGLLIIVGLPFAAILKIDRILLTLVNNSMERLMVDEEIYETKPEYDPDITVN